MAEEIREVFISYHEKSAGKLAEELADALESAGISCWYAKRDLPPGDDFADHIPQQIEGCKVFLLILNEGANTSRHVESEVGLAFRRYNRGEEITIMPYQVETCHLARWLDYYLVHIQILLAEKMNFSTLTMEIAHKLEREPAKNGWCGPGARWALKESVLYIKGGALNLENYPRGANKMGDFYPQHIPDCVNTPWWSDREKITAVVIRDDVRNLGAYAFYGCKNLLNIMLPNGISRIGSYAFYRCANLTSIHIPDRVTEIEECAFCDCASITSVTIPDGVYSIGGSAFYGCHRLSKMVIPDSVKTIGSLAFADCPALNSVSIPWDARTGVCSFDWNTKVTRRPVPADRFYSAENQALLHRTIEEYETGRATLIPKTMEELKAIE